MPDLNLPRHPASALLLANLGVENGIRHEVSLRGTRLTPEALADPSTLVSADQELRIIANLVSATPHPADLGIQAGMRYHLTTHGIWGFALSSSPNLRSALTTGLKFIDLTFAFCTMTLDEDNGRLVLDASALPSLVRRFLVERETASVVNVGRQLMSSQDIPFQVHFAFPAPPSLEAYRPFGSVPEFGADGNYIELLTDVFDSPLPQADAHTAQVTEAQCRQLLDNKRALTGYAGKVRDRLVAAPSSMPSVEEVASGLHMSSRTLRRHLDAEGTSFRALADEVRERIAEELLATGAFNIADAARRLGYADSSGFTTAFKRWKGGTSPSAYMARRP